MPTHYVNDDFQQTNFSINSFKQLLAGCRQDFSDRQRSGPSYAADDIADGDDAAT